MCIYIYVHTHMYSGSVTMLVNTILVAIASNCFCEPSCVVYVAIAACNVAASA